MGYILLYKYMYSMVMNDVVVQSVMCLDPPSCVPLTKGHLSRRDTFAWSQGCLTVYDGYTAVLLSYVLTCTKILFIYVHKIFIF